MELAKVQSTEATNAIEGIVTTNTRIRQLMEEKTTPRNRDEQEIAGYRDMLNLIHENFDATPIPQNYILQLYKILYKDFEDRFALMETKFPALVTVRRAAMEEGQPVHEAGHSGTLPFAPYQLHRGGAAEIGDTQYTPTSCATAQQIAPPLTTRRQFFSPTTLENSAQTPFVQDFFTLSDMYRWKKNFGHCAPLPALPIVQIEHAETELL